MAVEDDPEDSRSKTLLTNLDLYLKGRSSAEAEFLGHFLHLHLVIEKFLFKLIEARIPNVRWEKFAGIKYFSQKLDLCSRMKPDFPAENLETLKLINAVRNELSHETRESIFETPKYKQLKSVLYTERNAKVRQLANELNLPHLAELIVLELWAHKFLAYVSGYLSGAAKAGASKEAEAKLLAEIEGMIAAEKRNKDSIK